MTDLTLVGAQTRFELRGFLRNPQALIFTILMPLCLLLLFNAIFNGDTTFLGRRASVAAYYTGAIVSYQVMLTGFGTLLISVTTVRESGVLKRYRGTPMPSWVFLAAEIGRTIVTVAATVTVLVLVGAVIYHVNLSIETVIGLVVYVMVGTASFCTLGLAATRFCRTADAAGSIGPFLTVILAFFSGVFIPVAIIPDWLLDVGKVFPLEHLARGLETAFVVPRSTGITGVDVGVILIWGIAAFVFAVRTFRWEPLAAGARN
jgi:ABC-2 type transport system permease protein